MEVNSDFASGQVGPGPGGRLSEMTVPGSFRSRTLGGTRRRARVALGPGTFWV